MISEKADLYVFALVLQDEALEVWFPLEETATTTATEQLNGMERDKNAPTGTKQTEDEPTYSKKKCGLLSLSEEEGRTVCMNNLNESIQKCVIFIL